MDTREKILPAEQLWQVLNNEQWTVIVGRFDPLTPAQAARLASFTRADRKLAVIVEPVADALLPAEARAALVAAIRYVDSVAIADAVPANISVYRDDAQERSRTSDFVQFVLDRQAGALR